MAHHDQKIDTMLDNTLVTLGGGASSTTPDAINENNIREVERILYDLSGETIDLANNAAEGEYKVRLQNLI